jgi:hypothetical protein
MLIIRYLISTDEGTFGAVIQEYIKTKIESFEEI